MLSDTASSPLSSAPSLPSAPSSRSSSPLSSVGRRTPTPPPEIRDSIPDSLFSMFTTQRTVSHVDLSLPTPPPSQENSQTGSPAPYCPDSSMVSDKDGPPPAKRRRVAPKERTTEHLDLRRTSVKPAEQEQLDRLLRVLHKRRKIVVIAGAGISVSAGIPDFRSSTGLFNSLKAEHKLKGSGKDLFDASVYRDETSTSSFHTMVSSMSRLTKDAQPTVFHHMLATLAQEGRLLRLYSQNVDGIDTALEPLSTSVPLRKNDNGKWPRTVQLHGGLDKMVCSKCQSLSEFDADLFDGPVAPLCSACEEIDDIRAEVGKRSHGIGRLRPRMVLYNEHNPDDEAIGKVAAEDLRRRPDAVIVVGTTLKVPGVQRIAREMCSIVRDRKDGMAVWINNDPPPAGPQFADSWDLIVKGPADAVATHAALRKWDDPVKPDELDDISDEDILRQASAKKASVFLPQHLDRVPLLPGHINNSFRPPSEIPATPQRPRAPSRSPDFTPETSRRQSVVSTVEGEGDNITLESGLLTPSKSQKGSPAKMPSINDKLKDASKTKGAPKTSKVKKPQKKPSNVKYVKPSASQTKAKQASQAKKATGKGRGKGANQTSNAGIKMQLSTSKSAVKEQASKKDLTSPAKKPSSLSQVQNASSETLNELSPSDPRNNLSPTTSARISDSEKSKKRLSVASLMN